jgi:hypothetical protein
LETYYGILAVAAIAVGGNLLAGKIASNKRNDPKGAIGSGTAPGLDSGADIQITPVGGSEVQDFGDFGSQNIDRARRNDRTTKSC